MKIKLFCRSVRGRFFLINPSTPACPCATQPATECAAAHRAHAPAPLVTDQIKPYCSAKLQKLPTQGLFVFPCD